MIETIADLALETQNATAGAGGGLSQEAAAELKVAAAAIAVGLGALGTGIAQRSIGASAVGAVAEDDDMFVQALIFTALPETLIIIAFVTIFLV